MLKTTDYISKKYADTPPEFDPETDYGVPQSYQLETLRHLRFYALSP